MALLIKYNYADMSHSEPLRDKLWKRIVGIFIPNLNCLPNFYSTPSSKDSHQMETTQPVHTANKCSSLCKIRALTERYLGADF